MSPIVLRAEDPPSDAFVVVRGGSMRSDFVRRTATRAHAEFGIYAVSVFVASDESVETLCSREKNLQRYGRIRLSTVGRLKNAGFVLLPTFGKPHYDIVLPDVADHTLSRLERCFDAPILNPGRT